MELKGLRMLQKWYRQKKKKGKKSKENSENIEDQGLCGAPANSC